MSGRIAAVAGVTVIPAGCGGGRLRAAALGVQGLAPYFFEVEATAYVGAGSRRNSDDLQFVAGVRAWF